MLILASQSASRRAMLTAAGIEHRAVPAAVDERALEGRLDGAEPADIAAALARAKALTVSVLHPENLVLGGDSLVEVEGRRFDKPASRADAAAHLRHFSGRIMRLHSAAALARGGEMVWQDDVTASLKVRQLTDPFIESYLDREWPEVSGCVGVFRMEALGVQLFEAVEGDHFTILGMPLLRVLAALRDLGALPR